MENIKRYKQIPIPKDSAWNRKSIIKKYIPIWLNVFIEGIRNIYVWSKVIYKDKNWDSHYIFEIIKFKLLQQRNYLVNANRHEGVPTLNRDITLCLNLIELVQSEFYSMEYMDYCKNDYNWTECGEEHPGCKELDIVPVWDNFDEYFKKYKTAVKKVLKKDRNLSSSKQRLAMALSQYNQQRCHDLLFKVLSEKINHWWD